MQFSLFQIIIVYIFALPLLAIVAYRLRIKTLKAYHSSKGELVEVRQRGNGEKFLTLNKYTQGTDLSKTPTTNSYWKRCADKIEAHCKPIQNPKVLLLGLGAGTVPHMLNQKNKNIQIDIIEYDEAVIQANKDYFDLDKIQNMKLFLHDAYELLYDQSFNAKYDVILIDLFIGAPPYVSPDSQTQKFIQNLKRLSSQGTFYIFNRPNDTKVAQQNNAEFKTFTETVFQKVEFVDVNDPRGYKNFLTFAQYIKH